MKILVAVDGSNASIKAIEKAIEVARKYEASVELFNVVDSGSFGGRSRNFWNLVDGSIIGSKVQLDDVAEEAKSNAVKKLKSVAAGMDIAGVEVIYKAEVGKPYEKILEEAANGADMIVLSNRGTSGIEKFFLGSVAQRVIAEAKCPVLVVHSDAE